MAPAPKTTASSGVVTWPNAITLVRAILIVLIVWAVERAQANLALVFFAAAWALDFVDGFLARALHQETTVGFYFDKVVDRVLILGSVLLLVWAQYLPVYALFILTKDIVLIPALIPQVHRGQQFTNVGRLGKIATFCQGLAIIWLLLGWPAGEGVVGITALYGLVVGILHFQTLRRPKVIHSV